MKKSVKPVNRKKVNRKNGDRKNGDRKNGDRKNGDRKNSDRKKIRAVLDGVLQDIVPLHDDGALKHVSTFFKELNNRIKSARLNAEAVVGGSFAKGVWLRGDHDIDVFVRFDKKYDDDKLSDMLELLLKPWKPKRIHGSRDYFQIKKGMNVEVVPCRWLKSAHDAKNVTDYSFWHVALVNAKGKNLKNDIRLAKKFCKAQNIYGAESYIKGFSGHVLDLLVIHYGGFVKLLQAAASFDTKPGMKTIIDIPHTYRRRNILLEMNESKTQGPLILVDPVQPGRNAAAALGQEAFDLFCAAARRFLASPSASFFVQKEFDSKKVARTKAAVVVEAQAPREKSDPEGARIAQAFNHIKRALDDFGVGESGWKWEDHVRMWWVCKVKKLSPRVEFAGPPLRFKAHVAAFKKAHKKTFVRKNNVWAVMKREYTTPAEVVRAVLSSAYVKERLRNPRVVQ